MVRHHAEIIFISDTKVLWNPKRFMDIIYLSIFLLRAKLKPLVLYTLYFPQVHLTTHQLTQILWFKTEPFLWRDSITVYVLFKKQVSHEKWNCKWNTEDLTVFYNCCINCWEIHCSFCLKKLCTSTVTQPNFPSSVLLPSDSWSSYVQLNETSRYSIS